jgi:hypothetical protein
VARVVRYRIVEKHVVVVLVEGHLERSDPDRARDEYSPVGYPKEKLY